MISKKTLSLCVLAASVVVGVGADAAVTKKQSAIQTGTTVRARVAATGVYDQSC